MSLQHAPSLEPFSGIFETADGFSVLAGGLCPTGTAAACLQELSTLNRMTLGASKDCVVIDVRLSQMLRQSAPKNTRFLAASVFVPGAPDLCGGVAGDILNEESSAGGEYMRLDETVFGFALPGAGAMLLIGTDADARFLHEIALRELTFLPLSKDRIRAFLKCVESFSGPFLFVTDGSGGSSGCMCTQSDGRRSMLWLPENHTQNFFKRGDHHG